MSSLPDTSYARQVNSSLISPSVELLPGFTPKLNLGVMASGNGSNFEALVQATLDSKLDAHISLLIVNNPDCGAIKRAERLGIKTKLLNHREYPDRESLDKEMRVKSWPD